MTDDQPTSEANLSERPPLEMGLLENAKKSKPFGIVDFFWRRGPLIAVLGIPIFFVIFLLLFLISKPVYKVEGSLLLNPSKETTITGKERDVIPGDIGVFQRTLVLRIASRDIIGAALEKLTVDERPDFLKGVTDPEKAISLLIPHIKAKEVERTYSISVSLDGSKPGGLADTLSAVLTCLIEKLKKEQERQYDARLTYLRSEHEKIASRSQEERSRVLEFANTLDNRSFLREAYTTDLSKLDLLQKLYWDAQAVYLDKQAQLQKAESERDGLSKLSLVPFADSLVFDNFGINQITQWTYGKSQELRAQIDGLTPDNPERKSVEGRMQAMNDYMVNYKKDVRDTTIHNLTDKRSFELEEAVIKARSEAESAKHTADELEAKLKDANAEAARTSEGIYKANEMTYSVNQLRERLASINSRIDDAELEAKAPLPVAIDQMPVKPQSPASSMGAKLLLVAFVFSYGLLIGVCAVFDLLDDRIRSRAEMGAVTGGPGAQPIPSLNAATEEPCFANVLLDSPQSPASMALRDLALRVVMEHQRAGAKIIGLVGLHSRAGTTTVGLNLARAISDHGMRVLLAELPTAIPGLASAAGLPPQETPHSPWGNRSPDPKSAVELIPWCAGVSDDRVRAMLDVFVSKAASAYDCVLLDIAPIDTSDIAREAAIKTDLVIAIGKQDVALYQVARQTIEWVAKSKVPAVTVLLNFEYDNTWRARFRDLTGTGKSSLSFSHKIFRERFLRMREKAIARFVSKISTWRKK